MMGKYGNIVMQDKESESIFNMRINQARANELAENNRLKRIEIIILAFSAGMSKADRKQLTEEIKDRA